MKKIYFILCFQIALMIPSYAQVVPKGMNYQAVARDLNGNLIKNQKISLKIYLFGNENNIRNVHYAEYHDVITNALGLFNLIIGEGKLDKGDYGLIPWNTENIWLEVAIKDKKQSNFATVSKSKLLAVPYAIFSGTTDKIVQQASIPSANSSVIGVVSNDWSIFGNAMTDASGNLYHTNSLGTTDYVDLIMITDNVERLRVLAGGDIVTKLNFEVGQNLKVGNNLYVLSSACIGDSLIVKKNVLLNTSGGSTINNGPFTVGQKSPTLLSGTLVVDGATDLNYTLNVDGPTDLNDSLSVNNKAPTKLTGTLKVDSISNLNDSLIVNNMSPTTMSGTLRVDSMATFNDRVKVVSTFQTDTSGLVPSGSLQVGGGAYIKKNLYIGGIAKFGGPVAFGGPVTIQDGTQSISPATGALKVFGGVGIGLNLNVGGAMMLGGMMTASDATESLDTSTGSVKVFGGVGIRKRLNVNGATTLWNTLNVTGATTLNNMLNVTSATGFIANFTNNSNQHGISIQVNNSAPGNGNNFVEFRNSVSGVVGRIEGENVNEYKNNVAYTREIDNLNGAIIAASIILAIAVIVLGLAIVGVVGAATSFTACVGFGACLAAPVASIIVKAALDLASAGVFTGVSAAGVATAVMRKDEYTNYKSTHVGVTYESNSGDYAEWLPRDNPKETFLPGYIVGLKNGGITKNVAEGGRLLVISTQPIVLGNMPQNNELPYEKVAFLGQVPVHVLGKVNIGDYILPSGDNNGMGRAVSPANMKTEDYARIVGVAWSASENKVHNMINVAIGLNGGDIHNVVIDQKNKLADLKAKYEERNMILARLVPGYQSAAGITEDQLSGKKLTQGDRRAFQDFEKIASKAASSNIELTNDQLTSMIDRAESVFTQYGSNIDVNSYWHKIKTDPAVKEKYIKDLKGYIKNGWPSDLENLLKSKGN